MKIKNIIVSLVTLFVVTGCFKDESNYDYKKVPEIKLRTMDGIKHYFLTPGEELLIALKIDDEGKNYTSEFTYEWLDDNKQVVCTEKNYTFKANEVGLFNFGMTATDINTGAIYFYSIDIYVSPFYKRGFAIVVEDGGDTDMHFVVDTKVSANEELGTNDSTIYKKELVNVFQKELGEKIPGKPVKITEHWGHEAYYSFGELTLETQVGGRRKIIELNGGTLKKETYIEQEFLNGVIPTNYNPLKVVQTPWDSYILNNDGRVFARRNASNKGFHMGYYDPNVPLWGNKAYIDNIFFGHYSDSNLLLALEKDPKTNKKNFVGIFASASFPDVNSVRVVQEENSDLRYNDIQDEILFDDYFKSKYYYGMNAFITKNSSGQLWLKIVKYFYDEPLKNKFVLYFEEPEEGERFEVDLAKELNISSLKGMFTIKTYTDKIVYMYDDHKLYYFDLITNESGVVKEYQNKVIVAATGNSMMKRDGDEDDIVEDEVAIALGFDDGSFEIHELRYDQLHTFDKLVYRNQTNYGKIKQILHKNGEDYEGFTSPY